LKRTALFFLACFIFPTSLVRGSQDIIPLGTGVGMMGGYATYADQNHGGSVAFGLSFILGLSRNFAIEIAGTRSESNISGSTMGLAPGKFTTIPIQLNVQFRFPTSARLVPFISIGGGYYINTYKIAPNVVFSGGNVGYPFIENVRNSIGGQIGGGIDFFANAKIALGARICYSISNAKGAWSYTGPTGIVTSGTIDKIKLNYLFLGINVRYVFR